MNQTINPQHKRMTTQRMVIDAVLIAIYVVLRFFNIQLGNSFRFTLAPFSVILCAVLYGPLDGLIVGLVGEFLSQILGPFGLTVTTPLWCIGETVRGVVLGLCSMLFFKKKLPSIHRKKMETKYFVIMLICCVLTGVLAALGQTLALYVDSTLMGYYNYTMVFGVMIWRILVYILFSGLFGWLSVPIIYALKKEKLA